MEIYLFKKGQRPECAATLEALPGEGFVWLDFERTPDAPWREWIQRLTGVALFEQHVSDSLNAAHTSYYDGDGDYDELIFQGLAPDSGDGLIQVRTAAFFLFDRLLVTVHAADNPSFEVVKHRFAEQRHKSPSRPIGLMHLILDTMVDRYLAVRAALSQRLEQLQDKLLDPYDPFDDWKTLLAHRREIRHLGMICEDQIDAISAWRDGTNRAIGSALLVRMNDLIEHVDRVLDHARMQEKDIESAVQLHFSAVAHRTNEIMRILTVVSAIFLPLTFIVGVFGMNFVFMPELKLHYGYYATLLAMLVLAFVLLAVFRRKRWI